jgi:hypothetical protein
VKISLPDKLTSEAHLHKNQRKTETHRGQGWATMIGNELELTQTPRTIGENILETAKKWQEKQKTRGEQHNLCTQNSKSGM